jgi:hypothetical protein
MIRLLDLSRKDSLSRGDAETRRSPNEALIAACYEVSVGFAALSPPYTPFHDFAVSLRDVKSCYEKATHKGLDYGSVRRLFMVWGVPEGREKLSRKVSVGFAALSPPYTPFHGFRVSKRT